MTTVTDTTSTGETRLCHVDFLKLPSRVDYPDYYDVLKKPISYAEIKTRLDRMEYASLDEIRNDFNQAFVNAKRYNAPGSPIFLDAKRLHKVLKDFFPVLTGEAPMPDEDDNVSQRAESVPPPSDAPSPIALTANITQDPLSGLVKGTTLKQWLMNKLSEVAGLQDPSGRLYSTSFQKLPDKRLWEDYYRAIANPISFEMIAVKIDHRSYTTVAQFTDDVSTLLSNAIFWNERHSPVWDDAQALAQHFDRLMSEPAPLFIPPRKYNTLKRKAEAEAEARGEPLIPKKRSHHRGAAEKARQVAAEKAALAAQELAQIEAEEMLQEELEANGGLDLAEEDDPWSIQEHIRGQTSLAALGLSGVTTSGRSSIAASPAPEQPPPAVGRAFAGDLVPKVNGPFSLTQPSTTVANVTSNLPPTSTRLRPLSKVTTVSRPTAITSFVLTALPSPLLVQATLSCSQTRSHSITIPSSITRLEFSPSFTLSKSEQQQTPPLKALARPLGTPLEAVADLPPAGQALKRGSSGVKYVLTPQREGVTTVEFSIQPTREGQEVEVFRLFVSRS